MAIKNIADQLARDEGWKLKPYIDTSGQDHHRLRAKPHG